MDTPERPELTGIAPEIVTYIEWLEEQLGQVSATRKQGRMGAGDEAAEPPTTVNVISVSRDGMAKRTPRHLYTRQRRGGMGVFELEVADDDIPAALVAADAADAILIISSGGRAFRIPVATLPESPIHSRGHSLTKSINLPSHEKVVSALPVGVQSGSSEYVTLLSQRGWVRRVRASFLGPSLIQGTIFHDVKEGGPLVAATWTDGQGDLFIATRDGKGIRFAESLVPARGCLGIRLDAVDMAVGICGVTDSSGVFLIGHDGSGTIRLMAGFAANKAPGAGGKVAMKSDQVAGAVSVSAANDLLVISELGKIIRFAAADVPAKEGVVQGVACMTLRADEVAAVAALNVAPNPSLL